MAVNKILSSTSLSIEVKSGEDSTGEAIYSKKTFANIKNNADTDNVLAVAEAIKEVLAQPTRNTYINESSLIRQ